MYQNFHAFGITKFFLADSPKFLTEFDKWVTIKRVAKFGDK